MPRIQWLSVIFITIFILFLSNLCTAEPRYGATLSLPVAAKEPSNVHGFQLMLNYDPERFRWQKFNVYFDGGFSHFSTNSSYYSTLNIYSIAPVVRYSFNRQGNVLPFLELSIGLSYLNHTHFEDRKLGIHFAFQDRLGIGALLGKAERFSLGAHAVHYSNARMCGHNSGVTIPFVLDIGYRF